MLKKKGFNKKKVINTIFISNYHKLNINNINLFI